MRHVVLSIGLGALAVVAFAVLCLAARIPVQVFLGPGELFADYFDLLTPQWLETAIAGSDDSVPAIPMFFFWSVGFWWFAFSVASFLKLSRRNA